MIGLTIRRFTHLCFWLLIMGVALSATAWGVLEHYVSCRIGLEIVGTVTDPVGHDPLLGLLFNVIAPRATLSQAVALTIAVGEILSFFLIATGLGELLALIRHRRISVASRLNDEVAEATHRMVEIGFMVVILAVLLVPAVYWDLVLFEIRTLAGAGVGNPAQVISWAAGTALDSASVASARWFARVGAWGYLAFTALSSLSLEWTFRRVADCFTLLVEGLQNRAAYSGDSADQTATEAESTRETGGRGRRDRHRGAFRWFRDRIKNLRRGRSSTTGTGSLEHDAEFVAPIGQRETMDTTDSPASPESTSVRHTGTQPPTIHLTPTDTGPARAEVPLLERRSTNLLHDVIDDVIGERVSLVTARANPKKYYVDPGTGEIWDRLYYETVTNSHSDSSHGGPM